MKTKRIIGLAILSVVSAFTGVFLFTRIVDKPVADEQDSPQLGEGYKQFASMPSKQSQKLVDFTWAAEQTVGFFVVEYLFVDRIPFQFSAQVVRKIS